MLGVVDPHAGRFLGNGACGGGIPLQFERVVDALQDTAHSRCALYDHDRGEQPAAGHRALG